MVEPLKETIVYVSSVLAANPEKRLKQRNRFLNLICRQKINATKI
jgi:hypothetical protein